MSQVNPYNDLVNSMIELSLTSISTQQTVESLNSSLTDANQKLSYYWTSCPESNASDPGNTAYEALVNGGITGWNTGGSFNGTPGMQGWIQEYLGSTGNLPYSSAFMTEVEKIYMANQPPSSDGAQNSSALGLISSVSNLVSAAGQSDEQPGQNSISTLNTLAQHFESDQGPLSSATQTVLDAVNNYSSSLSQISA